MNVGLSLFKQVIALYGVVLPKLLTLPLYYLAKRAMYVITSDGTIKYVWYSGDPTKEPPYEEVIDTVNKLASTG